MTHFHCIQGQLLQFHSNELIHLDQNLLWNQFGSKVVLTGFMGVDKFSSVLYYVQKKRVERTFHVAFVGVM